jgi:CRP/FNR family transcriptional regulator, cyclic AMP receptor protein
MASDDSLFQRFGKEFPRGAVLFREGEPGVEMYVVQRGAVRITKRVGEVEKVLSTLGPGEFFGEMAVLSGQPRSATATCAEDSKLLVVDGRTFETMLRANSEIAVRMIRKLAERLQQADEQIGNLMLSDGATRVAHFLLGLAERAAPGQRLPVTAAELPARVGLEAVQVETALTRLGRARVIAAQDGGVAVPDVARLRQYLEFLQMKSRFGETP